MNRNTSIQKLNLLTENEDYIRDERSTTPLMGKKASLISKSFVNLNTIVKNQKFSEDVKGKLAYEWKNIYRGLT